jgi:Glycosyl hydrolases family 2, TIM barrel domain/Glycosyl hydrolases family 2, sugar binding domain/Glycosyl hydrolases family 2
MFRQFIYPDVQGLGKDTRGNMDRRTFLEGLGATAFAAKMGLAETLKGRWVNRSPSSLHDLDGLANELSKSATRLLPIPSSIKGIQEPVVHLGGIWKCTLNPPSDFWHRDMDLSSWSDINVPGEFAMQGFHVVEDTEYPCRRTIQIPSGLEGKRLFLRFDGVYGYARVWINGNYVRDHFGGFTSWDCEITQHVEPGKDIDLVVGITDRSDDISKESYYAKHSIAGILRDVRLIAVPENHLEFFSALPTLDSGYKNGLIQIAATLSLQNYTNAQLRLKLKDESGSSIQLEHEIVPLLPGKAMTSETITVQSPRRWDAEHPYLYVLEAAVEIDGQIVETIERTIGFRVVQKEGNQLLVNGQPVKLRGVCRHSIHPVHGRAVPAEFDELDARLFREANINFVRTSHYPPTEQFLAACDRHGIYVEEETAVCWSNVEDGPSSNPDFAQRFLSQFQEMIERDQDHAAVLFWSLGNESRWGKNFDSEYSYVRKQDPTRPLIFSYPDSVPWGSNTYDIYSKHYADVNSSLGSDIFPVLHDEFAHISCYNVDTLRRDPGVRNFWGKSIKRFGEKFLATDGCLGGSIWAGIDEVFLLPDGPTGYGPWGIIDGWRRQKPEYWLTKKAYSPIRVGDNKVPDIGKDNRPQIAVGNAFDHTNLGELEIKWSVGKESGRLADIDIPPHSTGLLTIPAQKWNQNDSLDISFLNKNGLLMDAFKLPLKQRSKSNPEPSQRKLHFSETAGELSITGDDFVVVINRTTGLITHAMCNNKPILEGGPFISRGSGILENWLLTSFHCSQDEDTVVILCSGIYGVISWVKVEFEIRIDGDGLIKTRYRLPEGHAQGAPMGISYVLPKTVDKLSWDRRGLWSVYPEDHIGRLKGTAPRMAAHAAQSYRSKPDWQWSQDMQDVFLFGKDTPELSATNDFRSLKEHILSASCILPDGKTRARIEASGDVAVSATPLPDGRVLFTAYNFWSYPDLEWGNYTGANESPSTAIHTVDLRLTVSAGD